MNVEFEAIDEGVRIRDRIESVAYEVRTGVEGFAEADVDVFRAPLTEAIAIETDAVVFPNLADVLVREGEQMVMDVPGGERGSLGAGTYEINVSSAPVTLYVRAETPGLAVTAAEKSTTIRFDDAVTVLLGARSRHEHPAGTITIRDTPRDLMRAVSAFGSALKTTSPERSFPTMRGHPPTVERGDRFELPPNVDPPETGVRIEVPPSYGPVYSVAPLAYYLGAEVVPGEVPRIVAAGRSFPFPASDVARSADRILRHCFTLDCVVRTEGLYPVEIAEREVVLGRADLDLAGLYDLPIDERTAAYLDVPYSVTDDVFEWHLTTDVEPVPEHAEFLPYLVNDFSLVRSPPPSRDERPPATRPEPAAVTDFLRSGSTVRSPDGDGSDAGVRLRTTEPASGPDARIISPPPAATIGHAWVGEGFPHGASKPTVGSYRRRLDRPSERDAVISIHVVCNDPEMREEAANLYGFRDVIEFDVSTAFDLTAAETRDALESDVDFLHYIGHITEDGMQCADDFLDLRTLDGVGVDAFILNGCRSFTQGMALVQSGALGGVVTLEDVPNRLATEFGRSVARLLDNGFDLHGALSVASENVTTGHQYTIVGNGGVTLCQHHAGVPTLGVVDSADVSEDSLVVSLRDFLTRDFGPGTWTSSILSPGSSRYLSSTADHTFEVTRERLEEILSSGRSPIIVDGELRWSDEIDVSEL